MSKITKCTIHITACDNCTVESIRKFHKAQGWSDIGYHWIVDKAGVVHKGRPENLTGAHVAGHNTGNIGISYISRGSDTEPNAPYGKFMTEAQRIALEEKVADILYRYNLTIDNIYGHNDFDKGKACPCFSVRKSLIFLGNVRAELESLKDPIPEPLEQAESIDGVDNEISEEAHKAIPI